MKSNAMSLLVAGGIGLAIGLYLTGSVGSVVPLLFVLACPLMMILMMRGMSGGHGHTHGLLPLRAKAKRRDRAEDRL